MAQATSQSKLIPVSLLPLEMRSAFQLNKWCTIIDIEGNADIFFKYYCTPLFNINDEEASKPQDLCFKLLKSLGDSKQFTINLFDRAGENIFDTKYFPVDILDPVWLTKSKNINSLKAHFPGEFNTEVTMNPNFKLVFLFNEEDIPGLFYEKTIVMKVDPTETIRSRERSQDQLEKSKKMREERHQRRKSDNEYGAKKPANSKVTEVYKGKFDIQKLGLGNSTKEDSKMTSTREGYVTFQGQQPVSPADITVERSSRKSSTEKVNFVLEQNEQKVILKMDLSLTPVVSETKTEGSIARKIVQETPKLGARVYFNGQMYDPTSQDNPQKLSGLSIRGKMPDRISAMRSAPISARDDLRRYQEASETATQEQMTETVGEKIEGSGEETIFDHRTEKSSMPDLEKSNRIELFRNRERRGYSNDSGSYKSDENEKQKVNKQPQLIIPGIASNSSLPSQEQMNNQNNQNNQRVRIHLESQEILSQVEIPENGEDSEDDAHGEERSSEYSETEDKGEYYRGSIDFQLSEKKEAKRLTKRVQKEENKEGQEEEDDDSDEEDDNYGTEEEREIRRLLRQEAKIRKKYEFMFNESTPVAESATIKKHSKKRSMEKEEILQIKSSKNNLEESDLEGSDTHTHSKRGEKRRGNTILGNQYLEEGKFSVRTSEVQSVVEVEEETPVAVKSPTKKKVTKPKKEENDEKVEKIEKAKKVVKTEKTEKIEKSPKHEKLEKIEKVEKVDKADESPKKSREAKKPKAKTQSTSSKAVVETGSAPNTDRAKRPPSISAAGKGGLTKNASTGNLLSPVKKAGAASPAQKQQVTKSATLKSNEAKSPMQKVESPKFSDLKIPVIPEKTPKKLTKKESMSALSPVKATKKLASGNVSSRETSPIKSPRPQTVEAPKKTPAKKEIMSRAGSITVKSGNASPKKTTTKPATVGKETNKIITEDKTVVPVVKTGTKKVTKAEGTKTAKK